MAFVTNPRRDASPTITGFVYQVNITILCWRELQEGEHLELEGARTSTPYKVTPMSRTRSRKHIHGHATHRTCKSPQRRISRALKLTQHLRVLSASLLISLEGLPIRAHRGVLDRPGSRSGQSFRLSRQSEGLWTAARPAPTPRPMRHPRGKLLPVE